ncbi:MAG: DUF4281 domain-containing protein [Oleispira sp.]|nr:DUF4281 domain-containing protein [Oleispira sp.]
MEKLSLIFKVASRFALVGWILLAIFPTWEYSLPITMGIVVLLLSALYTYLIFLGKHLDEPEQKLRGDFWSLKGVMNLFKSPRAVLAGWVHYLAFDLAVGVFIVVDAARFDFLQFLILPCLILTLMFGPAGLLAYFILRSTVSGELTLLTLF